MKMKAIPFEPAKAQQGVRFEQVVTVKRIVMTTVALLVFSLMALGLSTAHGAGTSSWYSNLDSARQQAQRQNKPLLVMIARTGCHACEEMEEHLSHPSARRAWANAVKVRLESSQYPDMTARFAAGGTPTTVIYAPGNFTTPVYTYTGVMDRGTIMQVGRSLDSL